MGNYYWSPGFTIKNMQESFVADAIKFYNGSKQSAANSLGITLQQLEDIERLMRLDAEAQDKVDIKRKHDADEFLARSRGIIGVDLQGHETLSPYVPAEGVDSSVAVLQLAQGNTGLVTPENAIPAAAVLRTAGEQSGDPLAAAKKTALLMKELLPQAEQTFPEEA